MARLTANLEDLTRARRLANSSAVNNDLVSDSRFLHGSTPSCDSHTCQARMCLAGGGTNKGPRS
jgi:hypothetical protein